MEMSLLFRCRSRGFGFITYKFADSVDEAQAHRPHNLNNKEVETKRATPREVNLTFVLVLEFCT